MYDNNKTKEAKMDSITQLFFSQIIKNEINSDIFDYLIDSNIYFKKFLAEEHFIFDLNSHQKLKIPAFQWLHHLIVNQSNYLEKEKLKKSFYKHFPDIFDNFIPSYLIEDDIYQPIFSSSFYPKKEETKEKVNITSIETREQKVTISENNDDLLTVNEHVKHNILSAKDEIAAFSNNIYLSEYYFYSHNLMNENTKDFSYSKKIETPTLEIKNEIIQHPEFYSLNETLIYHHVSKLYQLKLNDNIKLSFEDLNFFHIYNLKSQNINVFVDFLNFPIQLSFSLLGSHLNNTDKSIIFDFIKKSILNNNISFSWTLPKLITFLNHLPTELLELDFIFNFMNRLHKDYHFLNKYFFDFIALKDASLFKDLLAKIQENNLNLNVKINHFQYSEKNTSLHDYIENITLLKNSINYPIISTIIDDILIQLNFINEQKNITYLKKYFFENYITLEKIVNNYLPHIINNFNNIPEHLLKNKEDYFLEITLKQLQTIENKLLSIIELFSDNKISEMNVFQKFLDEALK